MKTNLKIATMSSMALLAVSSMATPVTTYSNDIFGKTLMSAYILGETEAGVFNPTVNPTRDGGSFAMTPNKTAQLSGEDKFFVAMNSDGFFDAAVPAAGRQDLISFEVLEDPLVPAGTISVDRRVVASAAGSVAGSVNSFTVNSIATNGNIALKLGKGSGNSNEWGTIMATTTGTTIVNYGSVGNYVGLAGSASTSMNVPTIGDNGWVLNTTFAKEIVASQNSSTVQSGSYGPNGRTLGAVSAANSDNRGSISYNSTAGIAAVLRTKQTTTVGMTSIQHVTKVAIYRITFDVSGNPELRDLAGVLNVNGTEIALPTAVATVGGNSMDLVATNYFSRSPFAGPIQVAVNDNGDIALTTVAVNVLDTTDTGQNQERGSRVDKRIISAFASANYATWHEAAVSGVNSQATVGTDIVETPGTGSFVTVNPVTSTNSIAVSNPAIDNDGNVYFTAAKEARIFGSGGTTVKTALFRCEWNGTSYNAPVKVLEEQDQLDDAVNLTTQFVTFLPLSVATSDLTNANIRFPAANCFNPNSLNLRGDGGLSVVAKVSDVNSTPMAPLPTRWSALYLRYK